MRGMKIGLLRMMEVQVPTLNHIKLNVFGQDGAGVSVVKPGS